MASVVTNGMVLIAAGNNNLTSLNSAELYNPSTGIWSATCNTNDP